ncbi:MAG: hypothetical protein GX770_07680 [Firmicutes bacterium]|nr:hypothetical protein [Bacillota bacterium]
MANVIWQELTSVEAEADQLISTAKQEANAYLAEQRQKLAAEREEMLATARKEGQAEMAQKVAEAEAAAADLRRQTDREIKDLRSKAAAKAPAVVDFIKERIRG